MSCTSKSIYQYSGFSLENSPIIFLSVNQMRSIEGLSKIFGLKSNLIFFTWQHSSLRETCLSTQFEYLSLLDLRFNEIEHLDQHCYSKAVNLQVVVLRGNHISSISPEAFTDVSHLLKLDLSQNGLLNMDVLLSQYALPSYYVLNISFNFAKDLDQAVLEMMPSVTVPSVTITNDSRFCCLLQKTNTFCLLTQTSVKRYKCDRMLVAVSLRVVALFVCASIIGLGMVSTKLLKNEFHSKQRNKSKMRKMSPFQIILSSVHIIDLMHAICLLATFSVDAFHGRSFFWYKPQWQDGTVCQTLGFVVLLVTFSSLFLLVLLSATRLILVKYPFFSLAKRPSAFWKLVFLCVSISSVIATLRSLGYNFENPPNYARKLCFLLGEKSNSYWSVSFTIFAACFQPSTFLSIMIIYICIVIELRKPSDINPNSFHRSRKVAAQYIVIFFSNSVSWLPSTVLYSISVSTDLDLDYLLMWNLVLLHPVNSVLNPLILNIITKAKEMVAGKHTKQQQN